MTGYGGFRLIAPPWYGGFCFSETRVWRSNFSKNERKEFPSNLILASTCLSFYGGIRKVFDPKPSMVQRVICFRKKNFHLWFHFDFTNRSPYSCIWLVSSADSILSSNGSSQHSGVWWIYPVAYDGFLTRQYFTSSSILLLPNRTSTAW